MAFTMRTFFCGRSKKWREVIYYMRRRYYSIRASNFKKLLVNVKVCKCHLFGHFSYRELMLSSSIRLVREVHLQGTKQVVCIMHDSCLL